jgi:hypothetical protein
MVLPDQMSIQSGVTYLFLYKHCFPYKYFTNITLGSKCLQVNGALAYLGYSVIYYCRKVLLYRPRRVQIKFNPGVVDVTHTQASKVEITDGGKLKFWSEEIKELVIK